MVKLLISQNNKHEERGARGGERGSTMGEEKRDTEGRRKKKLGRATMAGSIKPGEWKDDDENEEGKEKITVQTTLNDLKV
jgi:hypothetical protein